MATASVEERLATLEAEVCRLKERLEPEVEAQAVPWWQEIWGTFKDDPIYDEAMRLGREYREALRPAEDDEAVTE